jgi:hypothetical protein
MGIFLAFDAAPLGGYPPDALPENLIMFIAHGGWLRKYARWILAAVLVLLIPGFVALFTQTGRSDRSETDLPTVRGKRVNPVELRQARQLVRAQLLLSTGRALPQSARLDSELTQQAVMHMILLRKAEELGIHVSEEELVVQIRHLPLFLNDQKQFDPERYQRTLIFLNNYQIGESDFEQFIRGEIVLGRLQALVGSTAKVTPTEVNLTYIPLHEKAAIDLVQFDAADLKEPVTVADDEAKTFFEQSKETFRRPAQTKVRYVLFAIPDAKASIKLSDEEIAEFYERNKAKYTDAEKGPKPLDAVKDEIREELLTLRAERSAGDRATEFSVKLVQELGKPSPDFSQLAHESGVTPRETGYFTRADEVPGVKDGTEFIREAFDLNPKDRPFSDPVSGKDGFYVLEYMDSKPSEIPPFEEVKADAIKRLEHQRAFEATVKHGREALANVKQAMSSGKSFVDAARELSLKITSPEPFSISETNTNFSAATEIKQVVLGMATNSVSEFVPTEKGGLFFHLKERLAPDPAEYEKNKEQVTNQLLERNRQAIFQSWVRDVMQQEQVTFGRSSAPAPTPEPEETPPESVPAPAPEPAKS